MAELTDNQVHAELERIDKICPVGKDDKTLCELLEEAKETWIPGSNAIELFRRLAECWQALGKIKKIVNSQDTEIMQKVERVDKIARNARKGGSNG